MIELFEYFDKKRDLIVIELLSSGECVRSFACEAAGDLYFATLALAKSTAKGIK